MSPKKTPNNSFTGSARIFSEKSSCISNKAIVQCFLKFLHCIPLFFILASSLLWGDADITHLLITEEANATPLLEKLLVLEGIQEKNLTDIVAKTQENWIVLRQGSGGIERCDLIDGEAELAIQEKVFDVSESLGLFSPYHPERSQYQYAVCLGAFLEAAKKRLEGLISLWNQGIRFDTLVFLGGERSLREDEKRLIDASCQTEHDMLQCLWKGSFSQVPQSMKEHLDGHVHFVNTPRGKAARPSTADTYLYWLEQYQPQPGSVLAMSTIGLVPYQHLVGKNILGEALQLDTVCPEETMKNKPKVRVIFDTLAKCLKEIERRQQSTTPRL